MATKTKTKRNIFRGDIEVCCHLVMFWYDVGTNPLTDNLKAKLKEEAEDRAKTCINDDYSSGELNCVYSVKDGSDAEIRGWWEIAR